jgi:hypothetical protein
MRFRGRQRNNRRDDSIEGNVQPSRLAYKAGSDKTGSGNEERTCTRVFSKLRAGDGSLSADKLQDFERTKIRKSNFKHVHLTV